MGSPTDSSIDDPSSNATVKTFDDIMYVMPRDSPPTKTQPTANARLWLNSIITIPGSETLFEAEKIALFKKAEYGPGQILLSESEG
jgi:hypothetical protein